MALQQLSESDEDYHSLSGREVEDGEEADAESEAMEPPVHPMSSMQGAFEESILESTEDDERPKSSSNADAEARRQKVLEANHYDDSWTTRWKQKAGAQYHPLLKLMAQIVFGMHLLQQQQAKSDMEVVKILQTHVDEVDNFLEKSSEDFDLAIKDIEERIRFLKLPMTHLDVFDVMLDDKKFRTQLLDGNEKIEKIIDRTAKAMNAAMLDVQKGSQATKELGSYLDIAKDTWPNEKQDLAAIFGAMRGNEQGWKKCLKDLQNKGNNLGNNLIQLGTVIGEMSKLAAAASRRNISKSRASSLAALSAPNSPGLRSRYNKDPLPPRKLSVSVNKPLPREPDAAGSAAQAAIPKLHPIPFDQRFTSTRQAPPTPRSPPSTSVRSSYKSARTSRTPDDVPKRPKTAGGMSALAVERERRKASRESTAALADFLKTSGPLKMNPPDLPADQPAKSADGEKSLTRSRSQGAVDILDVTKVDSKKGVTRSQTHGASGLLGRPKSAGAEAVLDRPRSKGADSALSNSVAMSERKDSVQR